MEEHLGEEAVGPPLNMIGDRALFLREVPSAEVDRNFPSSVFILIESPNIRCPNTHQYL